MTVNKKLYFVFIFGVLTVCTPAVAWYDFLWIGYASKTILGKMKDLKLPSSVGKVDAKRYFEKFEVLILEKFDNCYQKIVDQHKEEIEDIAKQCGYVVVSVEDACKKGILPFDKIQEKWKQYEEIIMGNDHKIDILRQEAQQDSTLITKIEIGVNQLETKLGKVELNVNIQDEKSKELEGMIQDLNTKLVDVSKQFKLVMTFNDLLQKKLIAEKQKTARLKQVISTLNPKNKSFEQLLKNKQFEPYKLPIQSITKIKNQNAHTRIKNLGIGDKTTNLKIINNNN